jgi:hypothetical protein
MQYLDLDTLSKIAPIISAITAVIAAIFISRQIVNIRRNREVDSLSKIIALSDSQEMRAAKDWFIFELDTNQTVQQLKADREALKKLSFIVHLFETMGVLVNNGYISEKLIFDKYGLLIIGTWGRLEPLIVALRLDSGGYEYAENFELLVSRYDRWASKQPLKVNRGERLRLRDGKTYLKYERRDHERPQQKSAGSIEE